ncbi:hypothetical protein MKZ38_000054 [Zalerion maritima]|uniref:Growth hormone-inducible transmembrane protein n=1 Tax=Zalerion maritima TaxID=339359 RepID=A0AAD5S072_9PEZI|nr:hypothetical protein MKZ38_000054 [Zalerion maritima]
MTSAFLLRPSLRMASAIPKATLKPATLRMTISQRSFHSFQAIPLRSQSSQKTLTTTISRQLTRSNPFKSTGWQSRGYQQYAPQVDQGTKWRKIATSAAIFGGTLVAINLVFNTEGRTDGGMNPFERSYLNDAFLHTGLGVGIIGLTAKQMVSSGFVYRIMMANPWVVAIGGLAASYGTMIATRMTDPDNYLAKYGLWTAFNITQAAIIAPLGAFAPPYILARAGLYTVAMMGGLSVVGATAREDKYLYIGGPLMAGACIVIASGLAPLVIPATAGRTLAMMEKVWLYGGLAVAGGFTLYHVQAVQARARACQAGLLKKDPVNEAIGFELDFLNIFIRMVYILMARDNRRR